MCWVHTFMWNSAKESLQHLHHQGAVPEPQKRATSKDWKILELHDSTAPALKG